MLRTLLVIFLGFSLQYSLAQSEKFTIQVVDTPLPELLDKLEREEGYLFSYRLEEVEGISVSIDLKKTTIEEFCIALSQRTGLEFQAISVPYVVIRNRESEAKPIWSRILKGQVLDKVTNIPLAFATVYLQSNMIGVYTDAKGNFSLEIPSDINDTLVLSYVGYESKKIPILEEKQYAPFDILLSYFSFAENWVVITDYLADGIDLGEQGASTVISPARLGSFPGQPEPDILQTIQFLPGVSSPDGSSSSIYIRGSTPDQNLLLWEDIPIYQSTHLFGMISAFNPYILERVEVNRGGFGAEYGGRIAGLIDLESADQTLENNNWGVGINSTHSYVYGNLAFGKKQEFGLVFSARNSMSRWWSSPIQNQSVFREQAGPLFGNLDFEELPEVIVYQDTFRFNDANLKFSWAPHKNHQIKIAGFYGQNAFTNRIEETNRAIVHLDDQAFQSEGIKASWKARWHQQWSSEVIGTYSHMNYNYDYLIGPESPSVPGVVRHGTRRNELSEYHIKSTLNFTPSNKRTFSFGHQLTNYDVFFSVFSTKNSGQADSNLEDAQGIVNSWFANLKNNPDQLLGYKLGIRANSFNSNSNIFWEPRLRVWYKPTDHFTLQAHTGQYFQFISQVVEFKGEEIGLIAPMWRLNRGEKNPIMKSWQHQIGFIYHKNDWVLDVQGYLKFSKGISLMALGETPPANGAFFGGNSQAQGIDVLIKKRIKTYRTWISYSLSKTDFTFASFFDKEFPAPYDMRHQFSWIHLWQAGAWEFSAAWKWQSGLPFTEAVRVIALPPQPDMTINYALQYEEVNGERLPAQHQLDVSVVYQFHPNTRQSWQGWVGVSLVNVYNQRNVYQRDYFHHDPPGPKPRQIFFVEKEQLGFTPNAVLRFQF